MCPDTGNEIFNRPTVEADQEVNAMKFVDPSNRLPRSILVADDTTYLRIMGDPSSSGLLENVDSMVVPYSQRAAVNERAVEAVRGILLDAGQLTKNALLVKSPYDASRYEPADSAIEAFASAKYHVLATLLGCWAQRR